MPQSAPTQNRLWLLASLAAGISYYFIRGGLVPEGVEWAWKGAGVALLAVYALSGKQDSQADAGAVAAVMACGAVGDVLIELSQQAGALAFLMGHLLAIRLYLGHHRRSMSKSQRLCGLALIILVPVIGYYLPADRVGAADVALYALVLGAMAGTAWTSTFSRYRVGVGAVLFVASDLLIFARMGPGGSGAVSEPLIWPLYYFGQVLICVGVLGGINRRAMPQ